MLYLYTLHKKANLSWLGDADRVSKAMKELENGYSQNFGSDVKVLGGQVVEGALPREPDVFVVTTSLAVAKKNNLFFDSQRDEISYSVDMLDGMEVGVCRIKINSSRASENAKDDEEKQVTKKWWEVWK